jgi:hypothetical protein
MGPELYFILIYNVANRELDIREFGPDNAAAADVYSTLERKHRDDRDVEVVLVGADSIETIHKTHSHYFADEADDLFTQFLEAPHARFDPRVRGARRRRGIARR